MNSEAPLTARPRCPYVFIMTALLLSSCALFHDNTQPISLAATVGAAPSSGVTAAVLLPAGDDHLLTIRERQSGPILCEEPSPDWASAYAETVSGGGSGGVTGGPSASINGAASSNETVTTLSGRTAGVVALRDGLYSACQAYANGIIGKDAYGLILSQYGDLLVSLAGGSPSASGTSAAATTAAPANPSPTGGVAVAVSGGVPASVPSATPAKASASGKDAAGNPDVAILQMQTLQALLVACITDADPSNGNNGAGNPWLRPACPNLIANLARKAPALITPASQAPPNENDKSAAAPSQAVRNLQTILKTAGYYKGTVDGIDGRETEGAYQSYEALAGAGMAHHG